MKSLGSEGRPEVIILCWSDGWTHRKVADKFSSHCGGRNAVAYNVF